MMKGIYKKNPKANITLNGERLHAFPLSSVTRPWYLLSLLLSNITLGVLASTIRQVKDN